MDEIQGPGEAEWLTFEEHPATAELAAEIEEPPPASHEDEANLDMNALIDVCMVLLIFFILTTTVAALQKQMEAPTVEQGKAKVKVIVKEKLAESMIHVEAKVVDGRTVVLVEGNEVPLESVSGALRRLANAERNILLLEHDDKVSQDVVLRIIDQAKAAGLSRTNVLVP
jgi:biopolymer transport protein ExbD